MELRQFERMAFYCGEVHRRREFADESPMSDSQVHQMPIDLGRIGWNDEREIPVVHMTAVMKSGHSDIRGHFERQTRRYHVRLLPERHAGLRVNPQSSHSRIGLNALASRSGHFDHLTVEPFPFT